MAAVRAVIVGMIMSLAATFAGATDYYFSDCGFSPSVDPTTSDACGKTGKVRAPSGCPKCGDWDFDEIPSGVQACDVSADATKGSIDNPWCLAPEFYSGDSTRNSFETMMDAGAGTTLTTELASGDTVYLCAGDCDGRGSATWYLQPHVSSGSYVLFDPNVGSTSAVIINIRAFGGEDVTISGDSDNDNVYTAGTDAQRFWDTRVNGSTTNGKTGYQFTGFTIEKFAERTFNITQTVGGPFVLNGMTIQRGGAGTVGNGYFAALTGDGGMQAMGCSVSVINDRIDDYAVFAFGHNQSGASLTVENSTIRQNCQEVVRSNGNCYGSGGTTTSADMESCDPTYSAGDITMDNNTIYSVFGIQNGHQGRGWTWTNNTIYDFYDSLSVEENVIDVTITDNDISCRGVYDTYAYGKCLTAIRITERDGQEVNCNDDGSSSKPHCGTRNVLIARNKIYGTDYCRGTTQGDTTCRGSRGYLLGGIHYGAHNSSSYNSGLASATIENNMIWYTQSTTTCNPQDLYNIIESPLSIATNDVITVQNNTIFNNGCPTYLRSGFVASGGGTGAVSHVFRNNALSNSRFLYTGGAALNTLELFIDSTASGSAITYNSFSNGIDPSTNGLVCSGGTGSDYLASSCTSGTLKVCADMPTYGTGNVCGQCSMAYTPQLISPVFWDLRLSANDTVCRGTGTPGTPDPDDDIDGEIRTDPMDIGADEYFAPVILPPVTHPRKP